MEFFHFIPAIILFVYLIVDDPRKHIFNFRFRSTLFSPKQKSLTATKIFDLPSSEQLSTTVSLVKKIKHALEYDKLNFVMDEEEGMAWVLLDEDDQFCDERDVFILVQPDVNIISYSIGIIGALEDEDIVPITELCNRLNDRITYGRFVFDYSDASVRLIIYYHLLHDHFNRKRHQVYLGALLQYKLDIEPCFYNVKHKKELPIVAAMGK